MAPRSFSSSCPGTFVIWQNPTVDIYSINCFVIFFLFFCDISMANKLTYPSSSIVNFAADYWVSWEQVDKVLDIVVIESRKFRFNYLLTAGFLIPFEDFLTCVTLPSECCFVILPIKVCKNYNHRSAEKNTIKNDSNF